VSRKAKRAFVSLKKHTQKSSSCKGIQRLEESKGIGHWAVNSGVRETCHFFTYSLVKSVGCSMYRLGGGHIETDP
jgi:hypothetical protein